MEQNIQQGVPIDIVKRYILNKLDNGTNDILISRVYEIITGNTCISKSEKDYSKVNIIVHNKHEWK
jgi:hypothetical protein|tara:strand:- start:162 stop:359 length:198 start_codon:yes stop_codon:yes gene_type:complete